MTTKTMKRLTLLVVIILLFLLVVSCASNEKKIVGEWQATEGGGGVTFYKDGTVIFTDSIGDISGTYSFVDDDTIKVEMSGILSLGGNLMIDVSFSDGNLVMSLDGTQTEYEKVD